ncbi:hypothetical protein BC941DRAFT_477487 [Chlamydoabsidia padenii]|nr:hypothetical protein BC941DRAFT_477487 [Chlamydoabsidia padenii]
MYEIPALYKKKMKTYCIYIYFCLTVQDRQCCFNAGNLKPDVYVSGVDLPENHHYFGTNTTTVKKALGKRTWGSCSNNKCGFSFTSDQTGVCRDPTFPSGHQYRC